MPEEEAVGENTEEAGAVATEEAAKFNWIEGLPDDMRTDPSLQTIHGETEQEVIAAFAKQHIHAQRAMGLDKIAKPGKDATDEEMRIYFTATGCPETIDGYAAPTENVSDKFDTDFFNSSREEAHRLGLTPGQLAGMSRFLDKQQDEARQESVEAINTQVQEWETGLKKQHGEAYAQNTALAKAIINEYGGDEMLALLDDRGLGSHPAFFNMLAKIGRAMGEDEILGVGGTHTFTNTPEQAKTEWEALQLDKEFMEAFNTSGHPGHKAAVQRQSALFAAIHPEGPEEA